MINSLRKFLQQPLRLPHILPYRPSPGDPYIFRFNSERDQIVNDVTQRICEEICGNPKLTEQMLNESAYHEIARLEAQKDSETRSSLSDWQKLKREIAHMNHEECTLSTNKLVHQMADDVAGNFDPRVYWFARSMVPRLITSIMNPGALAEDVFSPNSVLKQILRVEGDTDHLRQLQEKGCLIYVPTHSSNMDSIVLAEALELENLTPVIYGAGKNLFSNPIISFFMHNLGAYRIDRRIRAPLYKQVVKLYSQAVIERGYHSLFFPGGTRSRSGMIESKLKLGLMGSVIEAFSQARANGNTRPIWLVPTTINYALVLEAETLIEDWLKVEGGARYIIEDDEFSQLDRWIAFLRKLVGFNSACTIRFGRPIDPFGNEIDDAGNSLKPNGDIFDPVSYVTYRGQITVDSKRDAAYTETTGKRIAAAFLRETVIGATQLVAHVLFRHLVAETPGVDLFSRMRMRGEVSIDMGELEQGVAQVIEALMDLQSRKLIRVSEVVTNRSPHEIIERAFSIWEGYHVRHAVTVIDQRVEISDPSLLLYYQNRLVPYANQLATPETADAARQIADMGRYR